MAYQASRQRYPIVKVEEVFGSISDDDKTKDEDNYGDEENGNDLVIGPRLLKL